MNNDESDLKLLNDFMQADQVNNNIAAESDISSNSDEEDLKLLNKFMNKPSPEQIRQQNIKKNTDTVNPPPETTVPGTLKTWRKEVLPSMVSDITTKRPEEIAAPSTLSDIWEGAKLTPGIWGKGIKDVVTHPKYFAQVAGDYVMKTLAQAGLVTAGTIATGIDSMRAALNPLVSYNPVYNTETGKKLGFRRADAFERQANKVNKFVEDVFSPSVKYWQQESQGKWEELPKDLKEASWSNNPAFKIAQIWAQIAPLLATSATLAMTGNLKAGIAVLSGAAGADQYYEALQKTGSPLKALATGAASFIMNYMTEFGLPNAVALFKGGFKNRALHGLKSAGINASQEVIQGVLDDEIANVLAEAKRNPFDAEQRLSDFIGGLTMGIPALVAPVKNPMDDIYRAMEQNIENAPLSAIPVTAEQKILQVQLPMSKNELLTPEGIAQFVENNNNAAQAIALIETPSRTEIQRIIGSREIWNSTERKQFADAVRNILNPPAVTEADIQPTLSETPIIETTPETQGVPTDAGTIRETQGQEPSEGNAPQVSQDESGNVIQLDQKTQEQGVAPVEQQAQEQGVRGVSEQVIQDQAYEDAKIAHRKEIEKRIERPLDQEEIIAADNLFQALSTVEELKNIATQNAIDSLIDYSLKNDPLSNKFEQGDIEGIKKYLNDIFEKNKNSVDEQERMLADEAKFWYDEIEKKGINEQKLLEALNDFKRKRDERNTAKVELSKTEPEHPSDQTVSQPGAQAESTATEVESKPRLAENSKDLYQEIIKKTESGVVSPDGKILYPVYTVIGEGSFRIKKDGIFKLNSEGSAYSPATKKQIDSVHDAIDNDTGIVELKSKWGGSGSTSARASQTVKILHSPSGKSFKKEGANEQPQTESTVQTTVGTPESGTVTPPVQPTKRKLGFKKLIPGGTVEEPPRTTGNVDTGNVPEGTKIGDVVPVEPAVGGESGTGKPSIPEKPAEPRPSDNIKQVPGKHLSLKEQKQGLNDEIDKAIKDAPELSGEELKVYNEVKNFASTKKKGFLKDQGMTAEEKIEADAKAKRFSTIFPDTITIQVPDDGEFTVFNNKQSLRDFKELVKKFPVTQIKSHIGKRSTAGVLPSTIQKTGVRDEAKTYDNIKELASTDEIREVLMKPSVNGKTGEIVVTDGRQITVALVAKSNTKPIEGFPDISQVIPGYRAGTFPNIKWPETFKLSVEELQRILNRANSIFDKDAKYQTVKISKRQNGELIYSSETQPKAQGDGKFDTEIFSTDDLTGSTPLIAFKISKLQDILSFMAKQGNKDIQLSIKDHLSGAYIKGEKEYSILMPVRMSEDITPFKKPPVMDEKGKLVEQETETKTEGIASPMPTVTLTPQDFSNKVEQLNKFAQGRAILRKGANLQTAAGLFLPIPEKGEVKITQEALKDDRVYMAVLSHELGHAMHYSIVGKGIHSDRRLKFFGDNLDDATIKKLYEELRAVTEEISPGGLAGKLMVGNKYGPEYFNKPTELIARFFEKLLVSPGNMEDVAPTAMNLLESQAVKHPIIQEFLEAAAGAIDKGQPQTVLLRDFRQLHEKFLGKRAGDRAYGDLMVWRAMKERGKIAIEKLIESKFKGVKDSQELLFKAAESIKVSKGGKPEFGTREFGIAHNQEEFDHLMSMGYEKTSGTVTEGGGQYTIFAKERYSPEESKKLFESLSPEGKQLILDFTAERQEAKDYFNREIIKDVNNVEGNVEGWVYHYFEDRPGSPIMGGEKFRKRTAGTRRHREGNIGYIEDFKKAMTKALVDLEGEKAFNDFIKRYFARVTQPLAQGAEPKPGWIEVTGTLQSGVGLLQEKKMTLIDKMKGEKIPIRQTRYQMPKQIYERFKLWRGLIDEASTAVKVVNDLNRYWRINVLAHPGTATTNLNSGAIQYSMKIITDFYKEVLTGNISMPQTKRNISALIKVLTPKGWLNAPDWIYGGDLSNYYGQFMKQPGIVSGAIDSIGNKALKLFSLYERYWKKVISTSESVSDLKKLNEMPKEGLKLPTEEERELIKKINEEIDLYGYDYDNVPAWLEAHQKSVLGQAIKPFAKYPYKYVKQILNTIEAAFDGTQTWQTRVSKILALTTMVAAYAMFSKKRKKEQKTPLAGSDVKIPARLQTRGRLFITTDDKGRELFARTSKYPFFNLTEAGIQFIDGNFEGSIDNLSDMIGSLGPAAGLGLLALNYRNKFNTYDPASVVIGNQLSTFVPGFRMLNDISRMLDPFQRKQETMAQTFTKLIPTTSEALQEKLHGKIRTEQVPIEDNIKGAGGKRTTVEHTLENYWPDILLSMLSGVYVTRIDPDIAQAYITRGNKSVNKDEAQYLIKEEPTIQDGIDFSKWWKSLKTKDRQSIITKMHTKAGLKKSELYERKNKLLELSKQESEK